MVLSLKETAHLGLNASLSGRRLLVCVTGLPGAGKSTVAEAVTQSSMTLVAMGSVVREDAQRRGLEPNDENLGDLMLKLRKESGKGAVAELCVPRIVQCGSLRVVIDGVRSLDEIEVFKRLGQVKMLAVHASPEIRFNNLCRRGRQDAPISRAFFDARDRRELSVGVGDVIALADGVVVNEGITLIGLRRRGRSLMRKWVKQLED